VAFEFFLVGLVGLITTMSVIVGAYLGLFYAIPERILSGILAFAAGSLIAALAIELSFEGAEALVHHGFGIRASWLNMALGFGAGAALYYTASVFLESKGAGVRLPQFLLDKRVREQRAKDDEKTVILSRSNLFKHLSATSLQDMLHGVSLRYFADGEIVFNIGDPAAALYVVADGSVELTDPNGNTLARPGAGQVFGEMALMAGRDRNATARVAGETRLAVIGKEVFERLMAEDATFRGAVQDMARERSLANLREEHLDTSAWAGVYRQSHASPAPVHAHQEASVAAGKGIGLAIIFGNLLDTIPGCLVIGAKFSGFESMSATLMVGMFLGGIPESAASATLLRRAGFPPSKVFAMWSTVILVGIISAILGKAFISDTSSVFAVIMQAVAAGAILAMVSHAMIPEAFHKAGSAAVLPVVLGFLFALYLALEEANMKPTGETSLGLHHMHHGMPLGSHSHAPPAEMKPQGLWPEGQHPAAA